MDYLLHIFDSLKESLPRIIMAFGFFIALYIVARIFRKVILKRIKPRSKNPLIAEFIAQLAYAIIILIAITIFFQTVGFGGIAATLVTGAGIMTFIVGFAFKDIGENFLSGILMAFSSPFRIGDLIETQGISGYVTSLSLRETALKSLDGKDVFIPNSIILKNPLFNYTLDGFLRYEFVVGIDYSDNLEQTTSIIDKSINSIPEILKGDKKPIVFIDEFDTNTVNVKVLYWIDTLNSKTKASHFVIKSKVMRTVIEDLNAAGINMRANIIEVKNYLDKPFNLNN